MASELVSVEQVDRDAAARHVRNMVGLSDIAERMECGEMDDNFVVQNYARHRLAALEAQASRIAELEAGLRPFSVALGNVADKDHDRWPDNETLGYSGAAECLTWGDLRQARTLLGDREG